MRRRYNPEDDKNKQARLHSQAKHQLLLVSTDELQKTLFRAWFEFSPFMSVTYRTSHSRKTYVSEHWSSLGKDSAEEAHESQQCKTEVDRRSEEQALPKPHCCSILFCFSDRLLYWPPTFGGRCSSYLFSLSLQLSTLLNHTWGLLLSCIGTLLHKTYFNVGFTYPKCLPSHQSTWSEVKCHVS